MTPDVFRARLRLGRPSGEPIEVHGDLKVADPAITHLCDALRVDGELDLSGCTNLEALPDELAVGGMLTIDGCVRIRQLPANLLELNGFRARGCVALESMAPITVCRGPLDLTGCTAMEPLAPGFQARSSVTLDRCMILPHRFDVHVSVPETVIVAMRGRRLGELVDHPLLSRHPIREATIEDAERDPIFGALLLLIDGTSLVTDRW